MIDFGAVKRIATVDENGEIIVADSTVGIGTLAYMPSVLCKMIAPQPSDRYQNAQQPLAALKSTEIILEPNPLKPKPNIPKKLILGVLSAVALLRYYFRIRYGK